MVWIENEPGKPYATGTAKFALRKWRLSIGRAWLVGGIPSGYDALNSVPFDTEKPTITYS